MLKGIDVNKRYEFVSKEDKSDPKTIFVLKPLTGVDAFIDKQHDNPMINTIIKSVVEVKNYEGDKPVVDIINELPASILLEILEKVNDINIIDDDSKKKL